MARYNRSYRGRRSSYSVGRERALEHIRQAESLSRELGGTDKDVKSYFFSLNKEQLSRVLDEYEQLHGRSASEYARKTLTKWQSGNVHMSGMVAERLFALLPKHMPIEKKFQLTESLWQHIGPSSSRNLYVNPSVSFDEVSAAVKTHLEVDVLSYKIPEQMERRFEWLSQGDVGVKQELLNFLRSKEKELAAESLRINLPILYDHINTAEGDNTHHLAHKLQIGKNEIVVNITNAVDGITEVAPRIATSRSSDTDWTWLWWIIGIGLLIVLFNG